MAYYIMYNIGRKYLISWVIFMGCYTESWVGLSAGHEAVACHGFLLPDLLILLGFCLVSWWVILWV